MAGPRGLTRLLLETRRWGWEKFLFSTHSDHESEWRLFTGSLWQFSNIVFACVCVCVCVLERKIRINLKWCLVKNPFVCSRQLKVKAWRQGHDKMSSDRASLENHTHCFTPCILRSTLCVSIFYPCIISSIYFYFPFLSMPYLPHLPLLYKFLPLSWFTPDPKTIASLLNPNSVKLRKPALINNQ